MPSALELTRSGFGSKAVPHSRTIAPLTEDDWCSDAIDRSSPKAQLALMWHQTKPKHRLVQKLRFRVPPEFADAHRAQVKRESPNIIWKGNVTYCGVEVVPDESLTDTIILESRR